jgi:multidrug efflux system membrane fusion protein
MRLIAIITSFIVLAGCHKQVAPEKTITPVKVAAVNLYQPANGTRYSATLLPGKQVSLAFRVSGFVTSIHKVGGRGLEAGDIVSAGTVLAHVRAEDYDHSAAQAQSQLDAAKETQRSAAAQLAQTRASHGKAESDFNRARILFEQQSITRPDFDAARAQLDVAAAQVDAARAQLEGAAAQIRNAEASCATARLAQTDTALAAPFTGAVMQRNVEVGMLAGPSLAAYSLADIATVKAAFGVPDTVVVRMRAGRILSLTAEALPGEEFKGTVTSIAPVADSETRLFQVEVTIPNRGMVLKPGMIASLSLQDAPSVPAVPVIPLAAVMRDRSDPSGFSVMVVEGKVARLRRIALGSTFGEVLAVRTGLKPGELVVRAGATMVSDGEPVEIIQ